ncbi:hypothetical protein Zmor_001833 [Zophobas morio]|uniref:Integrase catalytic domain-containing protein n=1 Tax=Zophobas morio TaxID=2755281 RepID=A0AA38IZU4_9CUCU|nr:hypothetical protein Zmor_001833 [Zophobas morio]
MGDLPTQRLEPLRPFLRSGIDYTGPVLIKTGPKRSTRTSKAYIALFICFTTKAIHIELVSDLSSEAFLAALNRFISRRGNVLDLFSDNGTNFIGANRYLKELGQFLKSNTFYENVVKQLRLKNTQWHFIPPRSPHMGGLWEAGVKTLKGHLRRVCGNSSLTFEELYTLLTRIEACVNSRPLSPLSNDPKDFIPLTPGHFLIGEPLTAPIERDLQAIKIPRLTRWQRLEQLRQHFWSRWSREYLTHLQQRSKWLRPTPPVKVGSMALLVEDNLPPLCWKLGRIVEVHPGRDGVVRVVSVKTRTGVIKRAVSKICVLPMASDTDNTN